MKPSFVAPIREPTNELLIGRSRIEQVVLERQRIVAFVAEFVEQVLGQQRVEFEGEFVAKQLDWQFAEFPVER